MRGAETACSSRWLCVFSHQPELIWPSAAEALNAGGAACPSGAITRVGGIPGGFNHEDQNAACGVLLHCRSRGFAFSLTQATPADTTTVTAQEGTQGPEIVPVSMDVLNYRDLSNIRAGARGRAAICPSTDGISSTMIQSQGRSISTPFRDTRTRRRCGAPRSSAFSNVAPSIKIANDPEADIVATRGGDGAVAVRGASA